MTDLGPDGGHRMLFIGGLHRSGTTLLARMLGEQPNVSSLEGTGVWEDEGQHLQDVYPTAKALGGPGRFAFSPEAHLDERSPLLEREPRERLLAAWEPYWDLDRRVLVEKSPPNLIRMRFLQSAFGDARFVAVARHPLAVAYATQKWSRTPVVSLVRHWVVAYERFLDDARHLTAVRVVRYEDLVAAPAAVTGSLLAWLGEPAATEPFEVQDGINERYLARFEPGANPVKRARAAIVARMFEQRVAPFGYSLRDPCRLGPASADVARILVGTELEDRRQVAGHSPS